jgi:hypothetical protein
MHKQIATTAIEVSAWAKAGEKKRHGCGGGLYLQTNGTAASWVFRYRIGGGRTRWMGLGPYDQKGADGLSLAQARAKATAARAMRHDRRDPLAERKEKASEAAEKAAVARARLAQPQAWTPVVRDADNVRLSADRREARLRREH